MPPDHVDPNGLVPQGLSWEHLQELLRNQTPGDKREIEFVYRRPSRELSTSYADLERMVFEMLKRLGTTCRIQIQAQVEGSGSDSGRMRVRFMSASRQEGDKLYCGTCGQPMPLNYGYCSNCGASLEE